MENDLEIACETIDAAFFTGDSFEDSKTRIEFYNYMARWQRRLIEIEQEEDSDGHA